MKKIKCENRVREWVQEAQQQQQQGEMNAGWRTRKANHAEL